MAEFIKALYEMPDYIKTILTGPHLPYAIAGGVIFLLVLVINNRLTNLIRQLFVLAAVLIAVFAFKTGRFSLMLLCFIALILLEVFRFIRYALTTARTNYRDRRFEERALEKAASRRGAFVNKQAHSGERRPIVDPDADVPMNETEIRDVVDSKGEEAAEKVLEEAGKASPLAEQAERGSILPESSEKTSSLKDPVLPQNVDDVKEPDRSALSDVITSGENVLQNRGQILSAIEKLKELKASGMLSEEEFKNQTESLYEKLG